jgi:CRP-like cAMP-binding protein
MHENLIKYCQEHVDLSEKSIEDIKTRFNIKRIKKKKLLHPEGKVCNMVAFIEKGTMRMFKTIDGNERTCDIILENSFVTDYKSLHTGEVSGVNIQAINDCEVFIINKDELLQLYNSNIEIERIGRIMAEKMAIRNMEMAESLSFEKPAIRFKKLLSSHPEIFQKVPQKYLANMLGISPESFSRIKARK